METEGGEIVECSGHAEIIGGIQFATGEQKLSLRHYLLLQKIDLE